MNTGQYPVCRASPDSNVESEVALCSSAQSIIRALLDVRMNNQREMYGPRSNNIYRPVSCRTSLSIRVLPLPCGPCTKARVATGTQAISCTKSSERKRTDWVNLRDSSLRRPPRLLVPSRRSQLLYLHLKTVACQKCSPAATCIM